MFDGLPVPPLPPDAAVPIGPGGQFALFLFLCFLLIFLAYFFFELCDALMSEEFWRDIEQLELRRRDKGPSTGKSPRSVR